MSAKQKRVNAFISEFCDDALTVLKKCDRKLRNNLVKGEVSGATGDFYYESPKGLYIRSITEEIVKWLIFSNLCDRYCMRPELPLTNNKRLDLALSSSSKLDNYDIAIEMKWVGFRKDGRISEWARKSMIDDAIKLHNMDFRYKYIMQFGFLDVNYHKYLNFEASANEFKNFDKRQFRKGVLNPDPIFNKSFSTWDRDRNNKHFTLILWEISRLS